MVEAGIRTNVYIDAFNLYYGSLKGTNHKWLDLEELSRRLLPRNDIRAIRYFTAHVSARPDDPTAPERQQTYLRALATLPTLSIHLGQFREHRVRMRLADPPSRGPSTAEVIKTEEKGSDVNLASHLLADGFDDLYDCAVIISNDSDLAEPVHLVQERLDEVVGIVNPHPAQHRSRELRGTFFRQVRTSALRTSQFPEVLEDARGEFRKPATW